MSGIGDLLDYPPEDRATVAESFLASIRGKVCSNLEQSCDDNKGDSDVRYS